MIFKVRLAKGHFEVIEYYAICKRVCLWHVVSMCRSMNSADLKCTFITVRIFIVLNTNT